MEKRPHVLSGGIQGIIESSHVGNPFEPNLMAIFLLIHR